jgi:hypothetical protein
VCTDTGGEDSTLGLSSLGLSRGVRLVDVGDAAVFICLAAKDDYPCSSPSGAAVYGRCCPSFVNGCSYNVSGHAGMSGNKAALCVCS